MAPALQCARGNPVGIAAAYAMPATGRRAETELLEVDPAVRADMSDRSRAGLAATHRLSSSRDRARA